MDDLALGILLAGVAIAIGIRLAAGVLGGAIEDATEKWIQFLSEQDSE